MIISMKQHATREEIDNVRERIGEFGYKVHSIAGEERVVIGAVGVGDVTACLESLEAMPGVERAEPKNTEEYAFKILGLAWADASPGVISSTAAQLAKQQRADGGWSQLPALESDAYGAGEALVALQASGMRTTDAVYQRGVDFLTRTQQTDGSWHVKTRSEPVQVYFETGYPHGVDQFISTAGASWATAALALTQPAVGRQKR